MASAPPKTKESHRTWNSWESLEGRIRDVIENCPSGYEVRFQELSMKLIVMMGTKHGNSITDKQRVFEDVGRAIVWDEYVEHHKADSWSINWDELSRSMICDVVVQGEDHETGRHVETPKTLAKDVLVKLRIAWGAPFSKL